MTTEAVRERSPASARARKASAKLKEPSDKDAGATGDGETPAKAGGWNGVKSAAYINLLADVLHNFSDGLALGVSFSKGHGLSTTMAVFFHEVPHNIADFAILISHGFSHSGAMRAQWASALGAVAGAVAGLHLRHLRGMDGFVAGGFIYVALADIVPLLLLDPQPRFSTLVMEVCAMSLGVAANAGMLYIEHSVPGACAH